MAAWHFITVPKDVSDRIKTTYGDMARGWGSLPIKASIGKTAWKTSIFPDKKLGAYLLPVKADVRKKEKLESGNEILCIIQIIT